MLALTLALASVLAAPVIPADAGARGYVYGLPLVIMELTKELGPVNQLSHVRDLATPDYRYIVRPNNDTLYTNAFIDVTDGPVVLHVPDTRGRYYVMELLDMNTNVVASIGRRTTGTGAGDFGLVAPGWKGVLPSGITRVELPQDVAWLLGRILVRGDGDVPAVRALQDGFTLTPLARYGDPAGAFPSVSAAGGGRSVNSEVPTGVTFFVKLSQLLHQDPPPAADAAILSDLQVLGVYGDAPLDPATLSPAAVQALDASARAGIRLIDAVIRGRPTVHGWFAAPKNTGAYGTDYVTRAVVARYGLGANLNADAVYESAELDAEGARLDGSHRYVLHLDAPPPVDAFWSLSLYDDEGFFVANPLFRYAIGDRTPGLALAADGSLDVYIQHDVPAGHEANWLPAPAGSFNLVLRAYQPRPPLLDGTYVLPGVRRVDR